MPLRRPTRLPGFDYIGFHRYFLTFCTYARQRVFVDERLFEAALDQIQRTCLENPFEILAYCFMPDHVHLVVAGCSESSDLRRMMSLAKQRCAYVFRTRHQIQVLWQEGYYERVLRSDDATRNVVDYVFNNPVRAGLVATPEAYPFSGGSCWPPES